MFIDFFFETPQRRDLDGGLKIAQDAICTALEVNDNRVVDIHLVDIHLVKRIDPLSISRYDIIASSKGQNWPGTNLVHFQARF